jgi:hypothetical protein
MLIKTAAVISPLPIVVVSLKRKGESAKQALSRGLSGDACEPLQSAMPKLDAYAAELLCLWRS